MKKTLKQSRSNSDKGACKTKEGKIEAVDVNRVSAESACAL